MGALSLWDESNATSYSVFHRLDKLEEIPTDHWGEIYIIAQVDKQRAIQMGRKVAEPIASLIRTLIPLYTAAVR